MESSRKARVRELSEPPLCLPGGANLSAVSSIPLNLWDFQARYDTEVPQGQREGVEHTPVVLIKNIQACSASLTRMQVLVQSSWVSRFSVICGEFTSLRE